jgi:NitT/TauT family transport system substrate-binding protein
VPAFILPTIRRFATGALYCFATFFLSGTVPATSARAQPLKIGYSDWPGWVAWQVAIDKNWFKTAGLDVSFEWFDYSASMDAFAAGKLDAVTVTNGDALVMGGNGAKCVMVMLTDYSNGNDIIVGKANVKTLKDLKGKKVGIEVSLVEHLLLLNGLKKAGMSESDVTLVNAKTNETPQVLGSRDVAAIGAWQPIAGEAMRGSPGSHALYTSADQPGLIYDVIADPNTQADAVAIMAARVGIEPATYLGILKGTKLLNLTEAKAVMVNANGFDSLYGSSRNADAFNVRNSIYKEKQDVESYIDPKITSEK